MKFPPGFNHKTLAHMTADENTFPEADFAEFLSTIGVHQVRNIPVAWRRQITSGHATSALVLPPIQLFCIEDTCKGPRYFDPEDASVYLASDAIYDVYAKYSCRNCTGSTKTFALRVAKEDAPPRALIFKIGEFPRFGDPLPAKLRKLAAKELDLLDKGYAAEIGGLGIAASAYYRRVVESVKVRLIDEIIKASRMLNASADVLADLERAKMETRFTQAVAAVKHGIPEALFINGHNPLTLLHDALSDHLHGKSDEECMELATIVRVLLAELAEKLASVFADRKEVESAVTTLLKRKAAK
jgi:hypothetical protein